MIYKEGAFDLLSVGKKHYIVNGISADFICNKGISAEVNEKFNVTEKLFEVYKESYVSEWDSGKDGTCIITDRIINLIIKRNYWNTPTYLNIYEALKAMKNYCDIKGVKKVIMPTIGCGVDRLEWRKVSNIIYDLFSKTDMTILVCKR